MNNRIIEQGLMNNEVQIVKKPHPNPLLIPNKSGGEGVSQRVSYSLPLGKGWGWAFLLLFSFLLLSSGVNAQQDECRDSSEMKPEKFRKYRSKRLAEYAFNTGNYYAAVELYLKLNKVYPKNELFTYRLGESYYQVRDYGNAELWYKETIKLNFRGYTIAKLKYANMLQMAGDYTKAIKNFQEFYKSYNDSSPELYRSMASKGIEDCRFAIKNLKDTLPITIERLSSGINEANTDFAPVPNGKDNLIFSSLPLNGMVNLTDNENPPYIKLYNAQKTANGNLVIKEFNDGQFNKKGMHTANGTFSRDKQRFYFTRCHKEEDMNDKMVCAIYMSELKDGAWGEAVKLGTEVNDPRYTNTQPNIGTNKRNEEVLFFSSDRPGRGGLDLWYSIKSREGNDFTQAINLGPNINTIGNEVTPFYDFSMGTLYFSSDGWKTLGGLDVVKSKWFVVRSDTDMVKGQMNVKRPVWTITRWSTPENIGANINSSVDDFYYAMSDNEGEGYFVSNRVGGITMPGYTDFNTCTCCDDIYKFTQLCQEPIIPKVLMVDSSRLYLADTSRMDFNLTAKIEVNKIYTLKNIYFNFDKTSITHESQEELNQLILSLNESPYSIIEVSAHTDSIGRPEYNLKLSQKRAETITDYLHDHGIAKKRLVAKGYGELQPIAPNKYADGTDNMDGRQRNRRAEFKIIGELEHKEN